jgi:hypothetical protein
MTVASVLKNTLVSKNNHNLDKIIPIITEAFIGETCNQVSFSYGDELKLDFGEMTPCEHPKLAHLLKGSWRFGQGLRLGR